MSTCPACASPVSEDPALLSRPAGPASTSRTDPTGTAPRPLVPRPDSPSPPRGSSTPRSPRASGPAGARPGERFAPGTVLGERYRIVGLLGRGGMGEVYRADDLKLEQPVALKFLPRALEGDAERLERLYGEVRMARQVSHPAVCRVWDIGEAEGQHFLSMEFVDGENLASLLRRIGRLPQDKALDIARQVAAGLAAAHEKGVLHRDLKPANVMLDGQGKVRLTDFGLAGLAEALSGDDVRSGTPSYMSPEQLQGREVTARSDIYALGLLIYELVTGRRAFEGKGLAELTRKHRDERPIEPSAIVPDLDPAVERTILACLEKDPKRRPPSALVVSAMLSGRDPLEAAIAAGETPSPELVAAAGESEGLRPGAAWACLLVVVLGALLLPATQGRRQLLARIPVGEGPRRARGQGPRPRGPPRPGGGGRGRRGGLLAGRRLPALGPGARPLRGALGVARHRRSAARDLLVPPEPAAPRAVLAERRGGMERPAGAGHGHGGRRVRPPGPAAVVLRGAAPARARERACPGARLGAALRRGAARPVEVPRRSSRGGRRPSTATRAPRGRAPGRAGPRSPCASRPLPTGAGPSGSRS